MLKSVRTAVSVVQSASSFSIGIKSPQLSFFGWTLSRGIRDSKFLPSVPFI